MAVYGRNREKWDPTKVKSKVSKNNTYELKTTTVTNIAQEVFDLKNTMWTHFTWDDGIKWSNAKRVSAITFNAYPIKGYEHKIPGTDYTISPASWAPDFIKIKASRFGHAINFGNPPTIADQSEHYYVRENSYGHYGLTQLFGGEWEYTESGVHTVVAESRYLYFSFWIYLHDQNSPTGGDGHTFAQLALYGSLDQNSPYGSDPAISFYISSSGVVAMRFTSIVGSGNDLDPLGAPGEDYIDYSGSGGGSNCMFVEIASDSNRISTKQWHYVTFALKFDAGWDATTAVSEAMIFVDGKKATVATPIVLNSSTTFRNTQNDENTIWEWQFGSLINSYGAYDSGTDIVKRSSGFSGALGEFTVISQDHYDADTTTELNNRTAFAKFLWEAQREGAYHLHSGVHSSTPRLEQLDLDRDSLYPSNFTLENYTQGIWETDQPRISKRSMSRFTEGYNSGGGITPFDGDGETWQENASQYFINSNKVMPHLRLHPADRILTNGNWYSDARSEFFPEDLDQTTGFVVTDQTSDELYREHYSTETTGKFVEIDISEEYKDCFVIDIPLPNTVSLRLGTDLQVEDSLDSDAELPRIQHSDGSVESTPRARISNMAYYNFSSDQWEATNSNSWELKADEPKDSHSINHNDIGFSPMTGIIVPTDEEIAKKILPMHGIPTSDYGFPFHEKFKSETGQSFNLSKYIDQPVILEGWEIKSKMIPVVGWSGYTNDDAQDSDFGFSPGSSGKSSFHYGAHGEAAVFFDQNKHMTIFNKNVIIDGSDEYHVGNTVPITEVSGNSEVAPTNSTPGLVTSGVTAFLLKKSKLTDTNSLELNYRAASKRKYRSVFTNLVNIGSDFPEWDSWGKTSSTISDQNYFSRFGSMHQTDINGANPVYSPGVDWVSSDHAWSSNEATSLVGWLQHVYHNDEHLINHPTRDYWVRTGDTEIDYRKTDGSNIVELLNKENYAYVQDLLYENTSEVEFYVQGKPKSIGQIQDGIPITNFFMKPSAIAVPNLMIAADGTQAPGVQAQASGNSYRDLPALVDGTSLGWHTTLLSAAGTPSGVDIPGTPNNGNKFHYEWGLGSDYEYLYFDVSSLIQEDTEKVTLYFQIRTENCAPTSSDGLWISTVDDQEHDPYPGKTGSSSNITECSITVHVTGANESNDWTTLRTYQPTNGTFTVFPLKNNQTQSGTQGLSFNNDTSQIIDGEIRWVKVVYENHNDIPELKHLRHFRINRIGSTPNSKIQIANMVVVVGDEVTGLPFQQSSNDKTSKHAESTMSETSINLGDGGLSDHGIIPRYGSLVNDGTAVIPRINIPTERTSSNDSIDQFHKAINTFNPLVSESTVIINPHDELVLGIQNSVSTAQASQQIIAEEELKFIRWGRTSLTIPAQGTSSTSGAPYLRLYVKKTRSDKDFNVVADSSNYNANVNRDLGDHANADQFLTSNVSIYSGSMADDIIGPTYFEAPVSEIVVPSSIMSSPSSQAFSSGSEFYIGFIQFLIDRSLMLYSEDDDEDPTTASGLFEDGDPDLGTDTGKKEGSRPRWMQIAQELGASTGAEYNFNWMFQNFTLEEIEAKIQDPLVHNANGNWDGITLEYLNLPLNPLTIPWTSLSSAVFEYGGPVPAILHEDDAPEAEGLYTQVLHGFITRNHEVYNNVATDKIILTPHPRGSEVRWEGGWLIEELNPNPNPPTLASNIMHEDRTRPYKWCRAVSAWNIKFKLPHYSHTFLGSVIQAMTIEFRAVKIDTSSVGNPMYTDGTLVAVGDAFFFTDDHNIVKVQYPVPESEAGNQKFKDGQIIFIVVAGGVPYEYPISIMHGVNNWSVWQIMDSRAPGTVHDIPSSSGLMIDDHWQTWEQVYTTIEHTLSFQALYNTALLYDIDNTDPNNVFAIKFKNDIALTNTLKLNEIKINDELGFELCGIDISTGDINDSNFPLDVFPLGREIFFAQENWNGAPDLDYGDLDVSTGWYTDWGGRIYDSAGIEQEIPPDQHDKIGNFADKLLATSLHLWYFCGSLERQVLEEGVVPVAADPLVIPLEDSGAAMITIDYSLLPNTNPKYVAENAVYNDTIGRNIDRKVAFRNSEKTNTVLDIVQDPTKIGKASTFGGLKRNSVFTSDTLFFWDAMTPQVENMSKVVDLTSFTPLAYGSDELRMGWILESVEKKDQLQFTKSSIQVQASFTQTEPALYDHTSNTQSIDYIYEADGGATISFPLADSDHNKLNVTNYFQRDFRGAQDFSSVTIKNLLYCFGDGVSGRLKIRPSVSLWNAYLPSSKTVVTANSWANELILDPPRGFRFGLLGYNEKPKYVFSRKQFGQFRDMLEQAFDSKYSNYSKNERIYGSPVVISSINTANPEVPKPLEHTSRYNKTRNAAIVKPYIEHNYEAIENPPNLNSESLRVDVAGSIRSRGITSPGGIAGNIRRRG